MTQKKYSLCIPSFDYGDYTNSNRILRIADYDYKERKFVPARYTEFRDVEYYPKHIHANPKDRIPYELHTYMWVSTKGNNDKVQTITNKVDISLYEIVKLDANRLSNHNDDSSIRKLLYSEINVTDYLSNEFLLVVNESEDAYEALVCSKKALVNNHNKLVVKQICDDISKSIHTVPIISINKNDVLDTAHLKINYSFDEIAPVRFFYNKAFLPEKERMLHLREPKDYATALLSRYTKINKELLAITKNERKQIIDKVETISADIEFIKEFFKETNYDLRTIENSLEFLSKDVLDVLSEKDDLNLLIDKMLYKNPDFVLKCEKKAEKNWETNSGRLKDEMTKELSQLSTKKELYKERLKELETKAREKELVINAFKEQEQQLKFQISTLKEDADKEIKYFQNNLVKLATMTTFSNEKKDENTNEIVYISGDEINGEFVDEEFRDVIVTFADDLQDNLERSGMRVKSEDFSKGCSHFLTSAILSKKSIIVCGLYSDKVANSISALISGKNADQFILPAGYTNIRSIVDRINAVDNRVVLLHCFLDNYNESIFNAINKLCTNKILIFSCEDDLNYANFPVHWSRYSVFLSLNEMFYLLENNSILNAGSYSIDMLYSNSKSEIDLDKYNDKFALFYDDKSLNRSALKTVSDLCVSGIKIDEDSTKINLFILIHILLSDIKQYKRFEIDIFQLEDYELSVLSELERNE